jgi:exodeoxyribonuclease VII large subunit
MRYFEGRWQSLAIGIPKPAQLISMRISELEQVAERLEGGIAQALKDKSQRLALARLDRDRLLQMLTGLAERLERFGQLLDSVSYQKILARGFALVRDAAGNPVLAAASVQAGASLSIQFTDGAVPVTADSAGAPRKPSKTAEAPKKQGSLF